MTDFALEFGPGALPAWVSVARRAFSSPIPRPKIPMVPACKKVRRGKAGCWGLGKSEVIRNLEIGGGRYWRRARQPVLCNGNAPSSINKMNLCGSKQNLTQRARRTLSKIEPKFLFCVPRRPLRLGFLLPVHTHFCSPTNCPSLVGPKETFKVGSTRSLSSEKFKLRVRR